MRNRQIVGDASLLLWCALWIWIGTWIYDQISRLGGVGESLKNTSDSVDNGVNGLPSVVRSIGGPLSSVGDGLRNAGEVQVEVVHGIAVFVAVFFVLTAIVPLLARHVIKRLIWMRRVRAIVTLRNSPHFQRLLAERALLNQPLHKLARVSADPMQDVKDGKFGDLVALELEGTGISATRHSA